MAFDAGALVSKLKLDKTSWSASIGQVQKETKTLGGLMARNSESFRRAGMAMTAVGAAIVGGLTLVVSKATDAAETASKFATIFQTEMPKAAAAVANLTKKYGLSTISSKEMLSATGDLLTGMGMQAGTALDLSLKTQQLAVDLASFTNYSGGAVGASNALTKAMLGERESLKGLGKTVTEEMVKAELARVGKTKLTGASLLQAKAEATLQIVMNQSATALGDYERTSDSLANKKRELAARVEDLVITLGTHLLPIFTMITTKITEVVTKISDWMTANPKLTETITKITLAVGAAMLAIGPLLIALPKIVAGMAAVRKAGVGFAGSFKGMNEQVGGLSGGLKKLPAIGAAAFVGWKVGRLIGEITGLDGAIQGAFEKLGIFNKYAKGTKTELGEGSKALNLAAKRQDQMAEATEIAGREITNYYEALKILGKITRDEVVPAQVTLAEKTSVLTEETEALTEKTKTWIDYIATLGISSVKEKKDRVNELTGYLKELEDAYADGKVGLEEYAMATAAARKEIENLSTEIDTTAIPAARDFSDVVGQAVTDIDASATGFVRTFPTKISEGISFLTTFSERIRDQFTTNLAAMLSGAKSFKDVLGSVWGSAKEQFFTFVAQMVSKWLFGFVAKIIGGLGGLGSKIAGAFGGAGKALTGAASGTGTGGLFGNILGGIGKIAGPLGIGLLVGKMIGFENIANTVKGVWIAVSDNVIASIKAIGKVADSVLGAVSDVISGIGKAIGGALTGLGNLLSGANKKDKSVIALLKPMNDNIKEIRDILFIDFRRILLQENVVRFNIMKDKLIQIRDVLFNDIRSIMRNILDRVKMSTNREIKMISVLAEIRSASRSAVARLDKVVSLLKNVPKSAEGRIFNKPALTWIAENEPEAAVPLSKAGQFGGKNVTFQMNMNPTVQLTGTITGAGFDPTALQAQIRDGIVPQILRDLMSNLKKSEWQKALGLI